MQDLFDHLFIRPSDYDASLKFYKATLGWQEEFSWGGQGEPRGACLCSASGMRVVVAEAHESADSANRGVQTTVPTVHIAVPDLDARYEAVRAGCKVIVTPEATHWGTRWFVIQDPDGNLLAFEEKESWAVSKDAPRQPKSS